jgi:hypothetical protein
MVDMPQVCLPFATDAKGQTFSEHGQGNSQVLLRPGAEEDEGHKTRYGAHTGSWTTRRICRKFRSEGGQNFQEMRDTKQVCRRV